MWLHMWLFKHAYVCQLKQPDDLRFGPEDLGKLDMSHSSSVPGCSLNNTEEPQCDKTLLQTMKSLLALS